LFIKISNRSANKPNLNEKVIFDKDLKQCYILEPLLGDSENNVDPYEVNEKILYQILCHNFFTKRPKRYVSLESTHEESNEIVSTFNVYNEFTDI
jgi:hypothetical protein